MIAVKHFERFLLLVIALAVGGGLGHKLLSDFEPVNMMIFAVCCLVLGEVFYQLDKKITQK